MLAEGSYRAASRSWRVSARLRLQKARTGRNGPPGASARKTLVPQGPPGASARRTLAPDVMEPPRTRETMYPVVVQRPDVPMQIGRSEPWNA